MTAYLMIGGPVHGDVKEVLHGRSVVVPDYSSSIDAAIASGGPLHPPTRTATYSLWKIPDELLPGAPELDIMKFDEMTDAEALRGLSAVLRPRLEAMNDRPAHERRSAAIDKFRAFLDEIDQHGRVPIEAWSRTP